MVGLFIVFVSITHYAGLVFTVLLLIIMASAFCIWALTWLLWEIINAQIACCMRHNSNEHYKDKNAFEINEVVAMCHKILNMLFKVSLYRRYYYWSICEILKITKSLKNSTYRFGITYLPITMCNRWEHWSHWIFIIDTSLP